MTFELWELGAAALASIVVGTWLFHHRVRVRVRPVRLETRGSRIPVGIGIEVCNRSGVPVTINEVGYTLLGGSRAAIVPAVTLQQRALPVRLQPGDRLTVRGDLGEADLRVLSRAQEAYAVTSSGMRTTGTSLDLRRVTAFAGKLFEGPQSAP